MGIKLQSASSESKSVGLQGQVGAENMPLLQPEAGTGQGHTGKLLTCRKLG